VSLALPARTAVAARRSAVAPKAKAKTRAGVLARLGRSAASIQNALSVGKTAEAAMDLGQLYDASDAAEAETPAAEAADEVPVFQKEKSFALGVQGQLLNMVGGELRKRGYGKPELTELERDAILEASFNAVNNMMLINGKKSAPTPEAFKAALAVFAQIRRVAVGSIQANPKLGFNSMNYVLSFAVRSIMEKGKAASSLDEIAAAAKEVADHAMDLPVMEAGYLATAFQFINMSVREAAQEKGIQSIDSISQLVDLHQAGLDKLKAEGRAFAPSDDTFQAVVLIAEGQMRFISAIGKSKGMDIALFQQAMETPFVKAWFDLASQVKSLEQAQALGPVAEDYLRLVLEHLPLMWAQNTLNRTMAAANALAEKTDPEKMTVPEFAGFVRQAAEDLGKKAEDAPSALAFDIAREMMRGFVSLFDGIAKLQGVTMSLLQRVLQSPAIGEWAWQIPEIATAEQAKAMADQVPGVLEKIAAAVPAYWASEVIGRIEAGMVKIVQTPERKIEVDKLTPQGYVDLAKESLEGLRAEGPAGAPSAEAFDASMFVGGQYLRMLEAITKVVENFQQMSQILQMFVPMQLLPALGQAQTLEQLKGMAAQIADSIVAQTTQGPEPQA
jgi:hypothetical protein